MNDNNRKEDIMSFEEFRAKRKNPIIDGNPAVWLIQEIAAYKVYKCKAKIKNKFIGIFDKTVLK